MNLLGFFPLTQQSKKFARHSLSRSLILFLCGDCHGPQTETARGRCGAAIGQPGRMGLASASIEACEVFSGFQESASRISLS